MACKPFLETWVNFMPHSLRKAMATSTESLVGEYISRVSNSNANISWAYNKYLKYLTTILAEKKKIDRKYKR